jgi:hypothetical protein
MGRKKIVFNDLQIKIVEKLSPTIGITQMCDILGIGEKTFYTLRKRDPRINTAYKKGRAITTSIMASTLIKIAMCHTQDIFTDEDGNKYSYDTVYDALGENPKKRKLKLLSKAYSGYTTKQSLTAIIFWLKTQAGWRETGRKKFIEEEIKEPTVITVKYSKED